MIGVDVGGTRVRAVVLDQDLTVRGQVVHAAPAHRPGRLADAVVACVRELGAHGVTGIGLVTPGVVERDAGTVRDALNLGIGAQPVALGPEVTARTGWSVALGNDVNAAAVAAHRLLGLADDQPTVLLSIGTGIAAGVVVGGAALTGARGAAGEIGHLPVSAAGPACPCGARGCLEAVASGSAMGRRWSRSVDGSVARSLFTTRSWRARRTRRSVLDALAGAVETVQAVLDPQCVVIGGGVSEIGDLLLSPLQEHLTARSASRPLARVPDVVLAPSPRLLGAIGAALSTRELVAP
jgi:predicted NBD/HSP70 family sugar kinase